MSEFNIYEFKCNVLIFERSIYFNKYNRYETLGAYNSKSSEYYPWYTFINYPNTYESWWGIDTLPNVNENNLDYTDFICSEGGVLSYWLTMGASGFRLDVADELPDEFLDNIRKTVKSKGKDKIVIGEVWEDASNKVSYGIKRRYLLGDQLDGTMNYPFRNAILDYMKGDVNLNRLLLGGIEGKHYQLNEDGTRTTLDDADGYTWNNWAWAT